MRYSNLVLSALLLASTSVTTANSEPKLIDDFQSKPETRWSFFTDNVMGGVSTGQVRYETKGGKSYARLTGSVSTENNGGFIQIRKKIKSDIPEDAKGIRLLVKGNNQRYFLHARTSGTVLPWQYYQAPMTARSAWKEVRIKFSQFKPSGSILSKTIRPKTIKSLAIVAYGREHEADIQVSEIGFY